MAAEQCAVRLSDGCLWVWKACDDLAHKHGVWFPSGAARDDVRYAIVYRWSYGCVRRFAHEYPHRLIMSEEEHACVAKRRARAAARRERATNPPASVHGMVTRGIVS